MELEGIQEAKLEDPNPAASPNTRLWLSSMSPSALSQLLPSGGCVSLDKQPQQTPPGLGGAGDIPAGAALSEGDGNPPVLIFGDAFPKQKAERRLEKPKDRWGKTTMVVTQ